MQIPRQSDGSRAAAAAVRDADELRARRRHLVGQLRTVGYWQRLVRARTDLSVAGLLYAAPAPADVRGLGWPEAPDPGDEVRDLASPPEGVDVTGLLGGAPDESTGAHLDRLRQVSLVLVRRHRALQDELDEVTAALHERLALDGADPGEGLGTLGPLGAVEAVAGPRDGHAALA